MTPESDAESYGFEEAYEDFANMDSYGSEHFLVYRRLIDESWNQAYNIFEDIEGSLNSYVPNFNDNSLKRYISRRGIDQEELLDDIREMDRFMDLARYGELRGEDDYRDISLEDFGEFMKRMKNRDASGPRDMQEVMNSIDEEASIDTESIFDSDEEALLTGLFIRGASKLRKD